MTYEQALEHTLSLLHEEDINALGAQRTVQLMEEFACILLLSQYDM